MSTYSPRIVHNEKWHLLISVAAVAIAASYPRLWDLGAVVIIMLLSFAPHELAHKAAAQTIGVLANYKMNWKSVFLMLASSIATNGLFFFAAPGAVIVRGTLSRRESGLVAASGPMANLVICVVALLFSQRSLLQTLVPSIGLLGGDIVIRIARTNAYLGLFNLLPLGPFDGNYVRSWSIAFWLATFICALILTFASFTQFSIFGFKLF